MLGDGSLKHGIIGLLHDILEYGPLEKLLVSKWYPNPAVCITVTPSESTFCNQTQSFQNLIKTIASAAKPSTGPETAHLLAAAGVSKGLPFPPAGLFVCRAPAADVEDGKKVRAGRDASADGLGRADDGAPVEVARPLSVDVEIAPVLIPEGPTTIGITTCRVLPLLSVVVFVMVELRVLVKG